MIRLSVLYFVSVLFAAVTHAGESTVELRPFTIEKSFTAIALPDNGCVLVQIEAKSWADFQIIKLAEHGSRVAKGDVLVGFDTETINNKLVDIRLSLNAHTLTLEQARLDLKHLQETSGDKLKAFRHAAEIAKEENSYFTRIRRKAAEETAAHDLERKKQMLSNQQEELRQLTKMYAADDVTEETEEIILTRQKDAVLHAEFALRMENLDYKRTTAVILPREAIILANNERDTAVRLRKAEEDIPRAIELRKLELENLITNCQREKETLAKLEADLSRFVFQAPADGWFYHGPIENGRWTPAEAVKTLTIHGRPAVNRPFATFIPSSAKLVLLAWLDEATARSLSPEIAGTAILVGHEDIAIPVKIAKIAATPAPDGMYRADLSVIWPKDFTPVPGTSTQVRMISYHKESAIAIPTKALSYNTKGWNVEVKLADGKTEHRPVKRGRVSKDDTEILSGLEAGQVVLTPGDDAKPKP